MDKDNPVLQYAVSDEAKENAFSTLRWLASQCSSASSFEAALFPLEVEYMSKFHPEERKRDGTYKFSMLPSAYKSAKSVLTNALTLGVEIYDKGKTAIEKEVKSRKYNLTESDWDVICKKTFELEQTLGKVTLNAEQREGLKDYIEANICQNLED